MPEDTKALVARVGAYLDTFDSTQDEFEPEERQAYADLRALLATVERLEQAVDAALGGGA